MEQVYYALTDTLIPVGRRSLWPICCVNGGSRVAQARAAYDATVADYRQTALVAFQQVTDNLTATRVLERQQTLLRTASDAANRSEATLLNRYQSGQTAYTDVVIAQATALNARRALLQVSTDRQTAAVALIQAIGGGWDAGARAVTQER